MKGHTVFRALFLASVVSILMPSLGGAAAAGVALPSLAPVIKSGFARRGQHRNPRYIDRADRGQSLAQRIPYFRRFFNLPEGGELRRRQFQSAGSGVIVDAKNGYIVTNRHVIENASEITVTLLDNQHFRSDGGRQR